MNLLQFRFFCSVTSPSYGRSQCLNMRCRTRAHDLAWLPPLGRLMPSKLLTHDGPRPPLQRAKHDEEIQPESRESCKKQGALTDRYLGKGLWPSCQSPLARDGPSTWTQLMESTELIEGGEGGTDCLAKSHFALISKGGVCAISWDH